MKNRPSSSARTAGFTLCSAMVAALLAGCAGGHTGMASTSAAHGEAMPGTPGDAELAKIEGRVAKSPRNAAARVALAQGYLAAGRFESATQTFEDAVVLGDMTARTGLSLALSYIGSGRNAQALEVLARHAQQLPVSDYGLAVALAGHPAEAVAVLSEAVKSGANNPKTRQNLAYAYALDGRWAEARVVASQDVSGEELDARLQEWAGNARPGLARKRVAGLLGTPLRADPGQPVALALNGVPDTAPRALMAAAEPVAPAAPLGELPAMQEPEQMSDAPAFADVPARSAPIPRVALGAPTAPRSTIERAFDGSLAKAQKAPVRKSATPVASVAAKAAPAAGGHVVQLGSFSSMDGARRAWAIFQRRDPSLRGHTMRITEADVNGRRYYRVAAEGFARGAAQSMCSTVKGRGGECLAYEGSRAGSGTATKREGRAVLASR